MNDSDDTVYNVTDRNPGGLPPAAPGSLESAYLDFADDALALKRGVAGVNKVSEITDSLYVPDGPRKRALPIFEATVALGREAVRVVYDPTTLSPEDAVQMLAPMMGMSQGTLFEAIAQLRWHLDLIEARAKAAVVAFNHAFHLGENTSTEHEHGPNEAG